VRKKSIHRPEYDVVLGCLVEARRNAGLTQKELAERIQRTQGYVSASELGDRRLDILQLDDWARGCRISLTELAEMMDAALTRTRGGTAPRKARVKRQPKETRGRGKDERPKPRRAGRT